MIFLVPSQISGDSFDGQLCFTAPRNGTCSHSAQRLTMCCPFQASSMCFPPGSRTL